MSSTPTNTCTEVPARTDADRDQYRCVSVPDTTKTEAKKIEAIKEELNRIRFVAEQASQYLSISDELPDAFAMFAMIDKLTLLSSFGKAFAMSELDRKLKENGLSDNADALKAVAAVETTHKKVDELLARFRTIVVNLPPGQVKHLGC